MADVRQAEQARARTLPSAPAAAAAGRAAPGNVAPRPSRACPAAAEPMSGARHARLHLRAVSRSAAPERVACARGTRSRSGARRPSRSRRRQMAVAGELAPPAGLRGGDPRCPRRCTCSGTCSACSAASGAAILVRCRPLSDRALGRGTGGLRAACRVETFPHHNVTALQRIARSARARAARRPIVVTDGYCPELRPAGADPRLRRPGRAAAGGTLVLDDTQALGILGEAPTKAASLRHRRRRLAALASGLRSASSSSAARWPRASARRSPRCPAAAPDRALRASTARPGVHCSPPSVAGAARGRARAPRSTGCHGDELQLELARLIRHFRQPPSRERPGRLGRDVPSADARGLPRPSRPVAARAPHRAGRPERSALAAPGPAIRGSASFSPPGTPGPTSTPPSARSRTACRSYPNGTS